LVKNIQAGCELYKQAKESFVEIRNTANEVVAIGKRLKDFGVHLAYSLAVVPSLKAAKSVAKAKKSAYVAVDETQVKVTSLRT
jgi:hypothetical protein